MDSKLKEARDYIIVYLMKMGFTVEEAETVLKMCADDINAAVRRSKFTEIKKEED